MSWTSAVRGFTLVSLAGCAMAPVAATQVCPSREHAPLRFVEVFDGSPERLASLMPDTPKERSGHWRLGYVYDAGRFVTVRCKYADGHVSDSKLADKVDKCDYSIDSKDALSLSCR